MASKKKQEEGNVAVLETEKLGTAEQCLAAIRGNMRKMQQIRDMTQMKVGDVFRQGDIYIEKVAKANVGEEILESRQLVDGHTKGSRHCITEGPRLYQLL